MSSQFGSEFDFFSNIPKNIQEEIERAGVAPTLSAPLLADSSANSLQSGILLDFPNIIGQDGSIEDSTVKLNVLPLGTRQIGSGKIGVDEASFVSVGTAQISVCEIGSIESALRDFSVYQNSIAQFRSFKGSMIDGRLSKVGSAQISITEVGNVQAGSFEVTLNQYGSRKVTTNVSSAEIRSPEISTTEVNSRQISLTHNNSTQIRITEIRTLSTTKLPLFEHSRQFNFGKISLPGSITLQQFLSSHHFNLQNTTVPTWTSFLQGLTPFNLNIEIKDLPSGQLAEASLTAFDTSGRPTSGTLTLDIDGNGLGWYIDPTPWDNTEFSTTLTTTAYRATPGSAAFGRYDLLTTILHEMGHLAGFINGYEGMDRHIQTLNGTPTFIGNGFTATLTPDRNHLDSRFYPHDLMNTTLAPGVRKLPSALNLQILETLRAWGGEIGRWGDGERSLSAPITATPLIGINNGSFDSPTGWDTRGSAHILAGQAVLREDSPLLTNFSQTFLIPEGATALQFTLVNTDLDGSTHAPGDAFEAALLNAHTLTSLVGSTNGLNNTDAFLNLQHSGELFSANGATLRTNPDNSRTVTVDLTGIEANTLATLYFDLLGFGSREGSVIIDHVRILTGSELTPIATDDNATTTQAQPVTLNLLANDRDEDGTLNPASLQLTPPTNGTLNLNPDGSLTYTPNPSFIGTDRFTYTVTDDDGLVSNTATVLITVNNTAPVIEAIALPNQLTEGSGIELSAIATDPGNDTLTYIWNFGDGTPAVSSATPSVTHTFIDNGTYTATLTVTDDEGAATQQTLTVTVLNAAPLVSAGADQVRYIDEPFTFVGQFTDPGLLDTHTVVWNFGDGTSQTGTLTPSHQYAQPGTYSVTLTVTDKDGAITQDTLTTTVRALPTMTVSDRQILEGDNGTAIALFTVTLSQPSTRAVSFNFSTANGTAIAGNDYTATSGTLTFAPGQTTQTIAVQVLGDRIDEPDETFFLNLAGASNATLTQAQAIATILDNDAPPAITLNDITLVEGDNGSKTALITVTLSEASAYGVTVNFSTANGTAIAGSDYTATSGTLTFAADQTSQTVSAQVSGDRIDEFDETFLINLSNPQFGTIADAQGMVTITDDDAAPTITINDRSITEGDNGTQIVTFTVSLSQSSEKTVSLNYATANGTAIAGSDYTATSGTLTFAAGQISQTVSVQVSGDRTDEFDETFFLNLSNAINADITDAQGIATIVNNDAPPSITVADTSVTEGQNGTKLMIFILTMSAASEKPVAVNFSTANGTAIAGSDYVATSGTVTFTPGQTTRNVTVQLLSDQVVEANEMLFLNLSNPVFATLADAQAIGTILNDDAAPVLSVTAVPGQLWPPNHRMVPIQVNIQASDDSGIAPTVRILSVTSNEPINARGDGNTDYDYEITADGQVLLRAERSGNGNGRVYTLTYQATDNAGNTTLATTTVRVPKNQGN